MYQEGKILSSYILYTLQPFKSYLIVYITISFSQELPLDRCWMKKIEERFGERVRELRRVKGLSQEELAFKTGVHRTYLGGIERGERNPSLRNIAAITKALGITLSELFRFGNQRQQ